MAPRRRAGSGKTATGDDNNTTNNDNSKDRHRESNGAANNNDPDYGDEAEELPPLVSEDILVAEKTTTSCVHPATGAGAATTAATMATVSGGGGTTAAAVVAGVGAGGGESHNCLHCHAPVASHANSDAVQVRCDECSAVICHSCHWCHEFQANHEIRVCDRCDAFYCRSCDEMDQCDDCGEVVCAACSTLLSCKFCGGGLCEDCATACGRCGIVLCSRDAKFAVDCDTCRLSYCLVCLASGSKDPCVRCGHRPSKRMEQLVHLRLKSIYKAFKQSSSGSPTKKSSSSNVRDRQNDDPDECHHVAEDPEALLQAAASAAKNTRNRSRNKYSRDHGASTSSPAPLGGGDGVGGGSASANSSDDENDEEDMEVYMEQKEKADAAAAALLAELEVEEEAAKSKKTKKKKKKKKQQLETEDPGGVLASIAARNAASATARRGLKKPPPGEDDDDEDDNEDELLFLSPGRDVYSEAGRSSTQASVTEEDSRIIEEIYDDDEDDAKQAALDPLEQQLCSLVADEDIEGLEELLNSVKGVPGRATLRKNAKKALKRFRTAEAEVRRQAESEERAARQEAAASSGAAEGQGGQTPVQGENGVELLKVVSHPHTKQQPQQSVATGSRRGSSGYPGGYPQSSANSNRTECVMHMAPLIVGWVIGKGGQRIRDLMEESGARIWIDQDSMGPKDPRIVYVSGNRKNVDAAVLMITELVSKAPTAINNSTPAVDASATSKPPPSNSASKPSPSIPVSVQQAASTGVKPRGQTASASAAVTSSTTRKGRSEQILTCEPRFVPLLIGRRGWTIKNIQDTSGARVDIDQTVTPRKISISGAEESVRTAMRMVNDVLSYPHAQAQGTEEEAVVSSPAVPKATPAPAPAPAATRQVSKKDVANPVVNSSPPSRQVHSPPSSLIMTGDAKSTISASSSLSSTPEPTTASSGSKANYLQVPPGPMLPPAFGYAPTPSEAAAAAAAGVGASQQPPSQPQSRVPNGPIFPPTAGVPVAPPSQDVNFLKVASPSPPAPVRQRNPVQQPLAPSTPGQTPGLADMVRSPPPQSPFPLEQQTHPTYHQQLSSGGLGGHMARPTNPLPVHHQQGAFHSAQTGFHNMPPNPVPSGQPASTGLPNASLWDGGRSGRPMTRVNSLPNPAQPPPPGGFRLDAAVDFLQHSNQARSTSIGLPPQLSPAPTASDKPIGLDRATSAPGNPLAALNPEDSRMIDSLFGPSTTTTSDSQLLPGLQGLSIGNNNKGGGLSGSGLWGSSALVEGEELRGLGGIEEPKSTAHLFGTEPAAQPDPQSMFGWGTFKGGQQS